MGKLYHKAFPRHDPHDEANAVAADDAGYGLLLPSPSRYARRLANTVSRQDYAAASIMPTTANELENRRPVWIALSSMFLDTDVAAMREQRCAALAASPYSLDELEEILITEVYPVCWVNLNSPAAEQTAFDPAWLESAIRRRESSGAVYTRLLTLARMAVPHSREWLASRAAIENRRQASADGIR